MGPSARHSPPSRTNPGARDGHEPRRLAFLEAARVTIQQHDAVLVVETPVPFLRRCEVNRLKRGHRLLVLRPSAPRDFKAERTRSFTL